MTKYCTECGKKLKFVHRYETTSYDENTGKKKVRKFEVLRCADYVSGYSDRAWHVHDEIVVETT